MDNILVVAVNMVQFGNPVAVACKWAVGDELRPFEVVGYSIYLDKCHLNNSFVSTSILTCTSECSKRHKVLHKECHSSRGHRDTSLNGPLTDNWLSNSSDCRS